MIAGTTPLSGSSMMAGADPPLFNIGIVVWKDAAAGLHLSIRNGAIHGCRRRLGKDSSLLLLGGGFGNWRGAETGHQTR